MLEMLFELIVFIVKVGVLVAGALVLIGFIFSMAAKQKGTENKFKVTRLNEKLKKEALAIKKKLLTPKQIKALLKAEKKESKAQKKTPAQKPRLFVLDFKGDIKASSALSLQKCVTQVINLANFEKDQVLVKIETPGGQVPGYGLAASELSRLKERGIKLSVSVDKVAASGGYLMACVANEIIAAPFAILGSIGVAAPMPNFHKLLKKNDIDYEVLTAGKYKRTLTLLGENTEEAKEKFIDQLEQVHELFKGFVEEHRPSLDMNKVGTGEYWFGKDALKLGLVDKIQTSEDVLLEKCESHDLVLIEHKEKQSLIEKFAETAHILLGSRDFPFL